MPVIEARELREHTAEVLRQIHEGKEEYIIMLEGDPVALLMPIEAQMGDAAQQSTTGGWEVYERLAEQVRQQWPAEQTTQEIIDAMRG